MFKIYLSAAAAFLALSSQGHANIYYNCPTTNGWVIDVAISDEEGIAIATWTDPASGSPTQSTLRDQSWGESFSYSDQQTTFSGQGFSPATLTFSNGYAVTCNFLREDLPGG